MPDMRTAAILLLILTAFPVVAADFPACAKTGAASVMFNGKPALKLSDVAACPPGTWEIIPNVVIEGEPMVHFNIGVAGSSASGSPNVMVDGKQANTAGDIACPQN